MLFELSSPVVLEVIRKWSGIETGMESTTTRSKGVDWSITTPTIGAHKNKRKQEAAVSAPCCGGDDPAKKRQCYTTHGESRRWIGFLTEMTLQKAVVGFELRRVGGVAPSFGHEAREEIAQLLPS